MNARITDGEHSVSELAYTSGSEAKADKFAEAPILTVKSVNRSNASEVAIVLNTEGDVTSLYYLVKESGEAVPTVEQVLSDGTKADTEWSTPNLTLNNKGITDAAKAYVVYLVAQTKTGTNSTNVVAAKVAKYDVDPIANVPSFNQKASTKATFEWTYDEETEGLEGYKITLTCGSETMVVNVEDKNVKEIDLFNEIKTLVAKGGTSSVNLEIIAVADNVDHTDSASAKSVTFTVPAFATKVEAKIEKDVLSWEVTGNVSDASYIVKVSKYNKETASYDELPSVNVGSKTSCDVLKDLKLDSNGIGTYKFVVVANPSADVLAAPVESSEEVKYHVIEGVKDLAISKVEERKVTFTATLLPDVYDLDSDTITYDLYYAVDGEGYTTSAKQTFTTTPYEYDGSVVFDYGKTYKFTVATSLKKGGSALVHEERATTDVKYTFEAQPINSAQAGTAFTYVEYKLDEGSAVVDPTLQLTSNQITYKDDVLYVYSTDNMETTGVVTYKASDSEEIANILALLKQMHANDTMKIENNIIKELKLTTPTGGATYDLSKVAKDTKVELAGNSSTTTVKGDLAAITLTEESAKFDLSGLKCTTVTVSGDGNDLTVANGTFVSLTKNNATINGTYIKDTASGRVIKVVANNSFETTGKGSSTLEVDSSKVSGEVTLTIDSVAQDLKLTASNDGIKVLTNTITGGDVTVLGGRVDLSNNGYKFADVTVDNTEGEEQLKVELVLDKTATKEDAKQGKTVKASANPVIAGSSYSFKVTTLGDAKYTVEEGSNVVTFFVEAEKTVTTKSE